MTPLVVVYAGCFVFICLGILCLAAAAFIIKEVIYGGTW